MPRLQLILLGLALPLLAPAQDSHQVARLEQEVRQLQREVGTLTQLVNQLRSQADRAAPVATAPLPPLSGATGARPAPPATTTLPRWVDAARWQRMQPGMNELQVIGELGPPTSTRQEGSRQTLFYALEVGPAAFLAGSITLQDRAVITIEAPVLK